MTTTDRRKFMVATAGVLTSAAAASALAMHHEKKESQHASMHKHKALPSDALNTMLNCIDKSELCIAHCYNMIAAGGIDMVDCARRAEETISMCHALRTAILNNSKSVAIVAKATQAICTDCADECDKFAEKHVECKECADSCKDCVEVCKTLQA